MAVLGDPPNYSTTRTLAVALTSALGALAHFALGAADYASVSRFLGLGTMLLAGLLLVLGVLTLIRYVEALDALNDPLPRTPMYDTPHEWLTYRAGVTLNALAALTALAWAAAGEVPLWHLLTALLNAGAAALAFRGRPRRPPKDS